MIRYSAAIASALILSAPAYSHDVQSCEREIIVLGAGQDAGAPQIGNADDTEPRLLPTSLAVIDHVAGTRYLFEATPAITEQLALLDGIAPPANGLGLDGIFLTHAHIGHYLGLAYFGREAAGAKGLPVYAMPRMAEFLRNNGPWNQLVALGNIELRPLGGEGIVALSDDVGILAMPVPHRDEYSETVGYYVITSGKVALFVPDLDSWDEWTASSGLTLAELIGNVDYAFIDATFFDDDELPGRDMSEIPHPRVAGTMDALGGVPAAERAKVHFIHYNHTNPVRDPASPQSREVEARGFDVARRGDRYCLD
ncbi:MBL fold metallo-hydrolase [Sphingomonadaceae bacterium]|nr:MBL fold metallo-hydrolase [Sphingomonadaceae bacterium]